MTFAEIISDSENPIVYTMIFSSLKDYEEREYIDFRTQFINIVTDTSKKDLELKIDCTNIQTIPIFHLYDFSENLNQIKDIAKTVVKSSTIRLNSTLVKYAFKILFKLSPPFSEIIYEET